MATTSGHEGIAKIGTATIAEIIDFSFTQKTSPIDDNELSDSHKSFKPGSLIETDGSMTCHWDVSDVTGQEAMQVNSEVTLNLFPGGDSTSDRFWSGNAIISEVGLENASGNTVKRSFTWVGNGAFTLGTVA